MTDPVKSTPVIELSAVYFCEGPIPAAISLFDCSLALRGVAPDAMTALYGNQSKQEGFMAARDYAARNRLNFTVIDFLVSLDRRVNPGLMKATEFGEFDFFALHRLARSGAEEFAAMLQASGVQEAETMKPAAILAERPELLSVLLAQPEMQHVKVVAFQTTPVMCERVLTVGSVPFSHWDAIAEATCRLNPTTRVTLDRPAPSPSFTPSPATSTSTLPAPSPAPRRRSGSRPA